MDRQQKRLLKRFRRASRWLGEKLPTWFEFSEGDGEHPKPFFVSLIDTKNRSQILAQVGFTYNFDEVMTLFGSSDDFRMLANAFGYEMQTQRIEFDFATGGYALVPHWNGYFWRINQKQGGDPRVEQLATGYNDPRMVMCEMLVLAVENEMRWYYKLLN